MLEAADRPIPGLADGAAAIGETSFDIVGVVPEPPDPRSMGDGEVRQRVEDLARRGFIRINYLPPG